MDIYPSLGLKGGRWVTTQSRPGEEHKAYPDGPVVKAGELEKLGVKWIHLVDVDGAQVGRPRQLGLVRTVIKRINCKVQVGGGYRTELFIDEAFRSGAARVALGTRAIAEPRWLDSVLARYGHEKVIVSIDCIQGIVAVDGWETQTSMPASTLGRRLRDQGIERIIFTDILSYQIGAGGPNYDSIEDMAHKTGLRLIVSGGVYRLEHFEELSRRLGDQLEGVLIARGVADGTFDLTPALELCAELP